MNEITLAQSDYTGTAPLYAVAYRLTDDQYANAANLEDYNASNWTAYAIPLALTNAVFCASFPLAPAGQYVVRLYVQAGATPAPSDTVLAENDLVWLAIPQTLPATDMASILLADALALISDPVIGEDLIYTPNNGTARAIRGIVNRDGYQTAEGHTLRDKLEVSLLASASGGITSVTLGRDKLSVPTVYGQTVSTHTITQYVSADAGLITVRLG